MGSITFQNSTASTSTGTVPFVSVGLDRQAPKNALSAFLVGGNLRPNQIQFLDEIVNHLTEHGSMDAARLYESPYTNFHSQGVEGIFDSPQVDALISILDDVRSRATG